MLNMIEIGYDPRPRQVVYFRDDHPRTRAATAAEAAVDLTVGSVMYFPVSLVREVYPTKRLVQWTSDDETGRRNLLNSADFWDEDEAGLYPYRDVPECIPMHEWQTTSFPSCNDVHQVDLSDLSYGRNRRHRQVRIVATGFFRDVWAIREYDGMTLAVLKTLRYEHNYNDIMFQRHRMDAVAHERLTSSLHVLNIHGFCGQSAMFEYAPGGDMSDILFESKRAPGWSQRFNIAMQVSWGVRDLHNFNGKGGVSAIAHADIMTNQFVLVEGKIKLSDFNRCTFLYWNSSSDEGNCPYHYGNYNAWIVSVSLWSRHLPLSLEVCGILNPSAQESLCSFLKRSTTFRVNYLPAFDFAYRKTQLNPNRPAIGSTPQFRSPEEYEYGLQSEKIDVYSMGNIFYTLLTDSWPFEELYDEEGTQAVREAVRAGDRPSLTEELRNSTDPRIVALIRAMEMCHIHDWRHRVTSKEVADFLMAELREIEGNIP